MFHKAVSDGDVTQVKFLLKYGQGMQIDRPNKSGLTALQQSCFDGNVELVNFLLEQGADLSLVNAEGMTALHFAALSGHLETVSLLINSACADVNAKSERGHKPIDVATVSEIRSLLSQAMVAEDIKRKSLCRSPCAEEWDFGCYNYKNFPGSRYSISSASTDSGVSEDITLSGSESSWDQRYSSNQKPFKSSMDCDGEDMSTRNSTQSRERYKAGYTSPSRGNSFTRTREENGSSMLRPSESPTGGEHDSSRVAAHSHKTEAIKCKRAYKTLPRDPSRRRTVTFGEIEYEGAPRGMATQLQVNSATKTSSLRRPPVRSSHRPPLPTTVNINPSRNQTQGEKIPSDTGINMNTTRSRQNSKERNFVSTRDSLERPHTPQVDTKFRNYARYV